MGVQFFFQGRAREMTGVFKKATPDEKSRAAGYAFKNGYFQRQSLQTGIEMRIIICCLLTVSVCWHAANNNSSFGYYSASEKWKRLYGS